MKPEAGQLLRQLIMGFRSTQIVYVAAKLGLADCLAQRPRTVAELTEEVGADPDALHRILRALTALGIFAQDPDGRFRLEAAGEFLRSNVRGSMRNVALLYGDEWLWRAYGCMLHSVQSGKSGFTAAHKQSFYEFLDEHAASAAVFQAAMDDFSNDEAAAILGAYSFRDASSIIDVGSGRGALVAAVLQAYPQLRGVAFDLPSAEAEGTRRFKDAGLSGRAAFVSGDFFRGLPAGFDLYLLKSVLHNWDDDSVVRVLEVCRQAMSPASRLLIIERVITDDDPSAEAKLFDINMLVTVGGRERTEQDYMRLLARVGFVLTRMFPTSSPLTIVEAALTAGWHQRGAGQRPSTPIRAPIDSAHSGVEHDVRSDRPR